MPRDPELLPAGVRISDRIAQSQIHRFYPQRVVTESLKTASKAGIRERDLPNLFMVYFAIMLCFYRSASQREVLRCMADGLQWIFGLVEFGITGKSGISQARTRIGWEPMKLVFEACAKPIAVPGSIGCFYKEMRLVVLDGSDLDLDDCDDNCSFFGKTSNQNGEGAYPKARIVSLIEAGTRVPFALTWGTMTKEEKTGSAKAGNKKGRRYAVEAQPKRASENALAMDVIPKLEPGMLCLADALFMDFAIFQKAAERGAHLLFRARLDRKLPRERILSDESYESTIYSSKNRSQCMKVRVVEFSVTIVIDGSTTTQDYRLITTLMDEKKYPARELASTYRERWEIETMLDEMKVHLMGSQRLRSKTPDLVVQEIYGMVMAYTVIRSAMYEAASSVPIDPDEVSFTHSKNEMTRNLTKVGAFSP